MNKYIIETLNKFQDRIKKIDFKVDIVVVNTTLAVLLVLSMLFCFSRISKMNNNYEQFKQDNIELVDSLKQVNANEIQAYKDSLLTVDMYTTLDRIETKLNKLNARPILKLPAVDTLYVVAARPVDTSKEIAKALTTNVDSLVSVINEAKQVHLNDQIRLVQYQDTLNTYKGILAENKVLTVDNTKLKRHVKVFAGATFFEGLYIALRSARVF